MHGFWSHRMLEKYTWGKPLDVCVCVCERRFPSRTQGSQRSSALEVPASTTRLRCPTERLERPGKGLRPPRAGAGSSPRPAAGPARTAAPRTAPPAAPQGRSRPPAHLARGSAPPRRAAPVAAASGSWRRCHYGHGGGDGRAEAEQAGHQGPGEAPPSPLPLLRGRLGRGDAQRCRRRGSGPGAAVGAPPRACRGPALPVGAGGRPGCGGGPRAAGSLCSPQRGRGRGQTRPGGLEAAFPAGRLSAGPAGKGRCGTGCPAALRRGERRASLGALGSPPDLCWDGHARSAVAAVGVPLALESACETADCSWGRAASHMPGFLLREAGMLLWRCQGTACGC